MVTRERNRTKSKKKRGRPKMEIVPVDLNAGERPEDFPSLIRYLETTKRVKHLTYAQQLRARHLYLRGMSPPTIEKDTGLQCSVIERLAVINGWEEERDKRLFANFRTINKLAEKVAPNVDERHDRIAGTIEQAIERILHGHFDGQAVAVNDLKRMSEVLKTTVEIRRTIRGKKGTTSEVVNTHRFEVPDEGATDQLARALTHALGSSKDAEFEVKDNRNHQLQISVGESIGSDDEFEDQDD